MCSLWEDSCAPLDYAGEMSKSAPTTPRPTFVYELSDEVGRLLYVGIATSVPVRLREHARLKPWWSDVAAIRAIRHPDRSTALRVEAELIASANPLHNVEGSPRKRERRPYAWPRKALAHVRAPRPDDELLDAREIAAWLGWARPEVVSAARKAKTAPFPEPVVARPGRRFLWTAGSVAAWDDARKRRPSVRQ